MFLLFLDHQFATGAMSFEFFGSYFPAWVACLMIGLFGVVLCHIALRQSRMLTAMPLLPVFYLSVCVFAGMASWLMFFSTG